MTATGPGSVDQPSEQQRTAQSVGQPGAAASRLAYLDSLRGVLMLLGIVLHAASVFSVRLTDDTGVGWIGWGYVWAFIHTWRMPAFFVIAGFFATLVLSRRESGAWWRQRAVRLGVPLLFAVVVVNTALSVAAGWWQGRFDGEGLDAVGVHVARRFGQVAHGWFLLDLLIYCSILAAGVALYRRSNATWFRPARLVERAAGSLPGVLLVFVALALPAGWAAYELQGLRIGRLTDYNLRPPIALYAAHFAFGCLIGTSRTALGNLLARAVGPMLLLAIAASLPLVWDPTGPSAVTSGLRGALEVVAGLAWAVLLLGWFRTLADRDGWLWRYLVDASLPVYLVHYPLVYLFATLTVISGLGAITGAVVTMLLTAAAAFALYETLNLTPWTRWLSTGRRQRGASLRGPD